MNCATGDFRHTFEDVNIPARGVPLAFSRTYDAASAAVEGPFGYGWHGSASMSIAVEGDAARITQENGSVVTFERQGDGTWSAPQRVLATLESRPNGEFAFTRYADHNTYLFSASGSLSSVSDPNGETTTYGYTDTRLTSMTDSSGRQVTFAYSGSQVTSIDFPRDRSLTLAYDAEGDLISTSEGETQWRFTSRRLAPLGDDDRPARPDASQHL